MRETSRGFLRPDIKDERQFFTVAQFCPVINVPDRYVDSPWGRFEAAYLGWSTNCDVRKRASSGGVLTSVLQYCLDRGVVSHVLQIGPDPINPLYGTYFLNDNSDDVLRCCGSRYVSCSAVAGVKELDVIDGAVAVVGRPCEVRALQKYLSTNAGLQKKVRLTLSFFCAGIPSRLAARTLLERMGSDEYTLAKFTYRGNGWPGFATAVSESGSEKRMSYEESWGAVLGRDIEDYCKFCFDGIGEYADISAGDAWRIDGSGNPDFDEGDGRNVIFARSTEGQRVLDEALNEGYITLKQFDDWEYLKRIQKAQYERKTLLSSRMMVLRLLGKKTISADRSKLRKYARLQPLRKRAKSQLGLLRRMLSGRIALP